MPLYADSGSFVVLEGGEGGGKSTQVELLVAWLRSEGRDVLATQEPGGTPVGQQLRRLLLDPATGDLSPRAESLVYAADKAEHVDSVIWPALGRGTVVVCDRYVDSTLAYQGAGRELDAAELEPLVRWATGELRPHLTVVLDVDPVVGLARAGDHDRIEAEPLAFHARVRQEFLRLADADPSHYLVVDADRDSTLVHADIRARVARLLEQRR